MLPTAFIAISKKLIAERIAPNLLAFVGMPLISCLSFGLAQMPEPPHRQSGSPWPSRILTSDAVFYFPLTLLWISLLPSIIAQHYRSFLGPLDLSNFALYSALCSESSVFCACFVNFSIFTYHFRMNQSLFERLCSIVQVLYFQLLRLFAVNGTYGPGLV